MTDNLDLSEASPIEPVSPLQPSDPNQVLAERSSPDDTITSPLTAARPLGISACLAAALVVEANPKSEQPSQPSEKQVPYFH